MSRAQKAPRNTDSFVTTMPGMKVRKAPAGRDQTIIDRANAAKARATGIDVTDISDDELLADLRRRRVSA
jgi:hypothetical protein